MQLKIPAGLLRCDGGPDPKNVEPLLEIFAEWSEHLKHSDFADVLNPVDDSGIEPKEDNANDLDVPDGPEFRGPQP